MGQNLSFFFRFSFHGGPKLLRIQHNHQQQQQQPYNNHSTSIYLPQELSFHILEYLDTRTKFIIQRVNRCQWYRTVTYWLSLQETLVFERLDHNNNNNSSSSSSSSSNSSNNSHTSSSSNGSGNNNYGGGNSNMSNLLTISDAAFCQFVTMLDKCYQDYKQELLLLSSSSSSSSLSSHYHHHHHDRVNSGDDNICDNNYNNNNNNSNSHSVTRNGNATTNNTHTNNTTNAATMNMNMMMTNEGMDVTTTCNTTTHSQSPSQQQQQQQQQMFPCFKFASLRRITLVQSRNLQNHNTLSSHFQLPLLKMYKSNIIAGDYCYHVGRSAISLEFRTSSQKTIESKPIAKRRFGIGLAANSSIGKRRVGHLSLFGNYVHYYYNPQWWRDAATAATTTTAATAANNTSNNQRTTTVHSAYVNASSLLGPIQETDLKYDYDTEYCTTIFVDDNCYRVFVDSECSGGGDSSSRSSNGSNNGTKVKVPSTSWIWIGGGGDSSYEIKRKKETSFPFRHTVDSNVLCNVLDQVNIVHNKDVIQLRHICFHHIPSWVNKTDLFNEHSFSVRYRPELTSIVDKNALYSPTTETEETI